MRRVREDFPAGEIIDLGEPRWGNTNPGDEADFPVKDKDRVRGEKDDGVDKVRERLRDNRNDPKKKDAAFLREYRFYSPGNTKDFVHIR